MVVAGGVDAWGMGGAMRKLTPTVSSRGGSWRWTGAVVAEELTHARAHTRGGRATAGMAKACYGVAGRSWFGQALRHGHRGAAGPAQDRGTRARSRKRPVTDSRRRLEASGGGGGGATRLGRAT